MGCGTSSSNTGGGKRKAAYTLRGDANWDIFEASVREGKPKWIPNLGANTFLEILDRVEKELRQELQTTLRKNDDPSDIRVWQACKSRALFYTNYNRDPIRAEVAWEAALFAAKDARNGHDVLAECYLNLGKFYQNQGRLDKAEGNFNQAIEEIEKHCGKHSDPRVAEYLRAIPDLYVHGYKSKWGEAAALYEHILDLNPVESVELAELCRNLFRCYVTGKLKAKPVEFRGKQACELTRQFLGPKHAESKLIVNEFNDWAGKNGVQLFVA